MESPIGSHRLLQAKDIVDETINWTTPLTFNPEINPDRYRITHNDILFIARGYENKAYLANNPPGNILASNTFYIIKPLKIQPGFLAWWLNQKAAQAYFSQFQVKMGYAYMSKKNLSNFPVLVPNIKTQETIAEVLRLWDREQLLASEIKDLRESIITSTLLTATENKEG